MCVQAGEAGSAEDPRAEDRVPWCGSRASDPSRNRKARAGRATGRRRATVVTRETPCARVCSNRPAPGTRNMERFLSLLLLCYALYQKFDGVVSDQGELTTSRPSQSQSPVLSRGGGDNLFKML